MRLPAGHLSHENAFFVQYQITYKNPSLITNCQKREKKSPFSNKSVIHKMDRITTLLVSQHI